MADICVKKYFEGEDGYLIPAEYKIYLESAKEDDLTGLLGKCRAFLLMPKWHS